MSNTKPVTYSDHAERRLKERGIRKPEVRWLLAKGLPEPDKVISPDPAARSRRGMLRGRDARVIYTETRDSVFVITVMWVE